jgi:hypothetical protein
MKMRLLSTVGAVALVIGFAAASAQTTMEKGGASSGATEKAPATGTEHGGAAGENRVPAARPNTGEMQKSQPSEKQVQGNPSKSEGRAEGKSEGREGRHEGRAAEGKTDSKTEKSAQGAEGTQRGAGENGRMSSDSRNPESKANADHAAERGSSGKTVGAAGAGGTNLTTEQRTEIRQQVISRGPRVDHVDFALHVGTVVPRDVRIVEVPTVIVDMHPEWRGYRYFVVNDQVIIVEPDTSRIVAVLDV